MNKMLIIVLSMALCACSSTPKLDKNVEFERLYLALAMEKVLRSFGREIHIDPEHLFSETISNMSETQKRVFIESVPNTISANSLDLSAAKGVFKAKILSLLSTEELKKAADFYSTNAGLKVHQAIKEAEISVSNSLDY